MTYAYADTNLILRYLLNDHPSLSVRARAIVSAPNAELMITDVVLAELYYVLRGKGYARVAVAQIMRGLAEQPAFYFDQESRLSLLFTLIEETSLDFVDCYLIARAISSGESLETFDVKMQKAYDKYRRVS